MPISTWFTDLLPSGSDDAGSKAADEARAKAVRQNSWVLGGRGTMTADYKRVTHAGGGKAQNALGAPPPRPTNKRGI